MKKSVAFAAALAASSLLASVPAQAAGCWGPRAVDAAKLRNLDIMLMVTALHCRKGADNFQPAYHDFAAAHQGELNAANAVLRDALGEGPGGATRALDKMSVVIANSFGTGHPEMGCAQLASVARDLAVTRVPGALLDAADALVGAPAIPAGSCTARIATVRR